MKKILLLLTTVLSITQVNAQFIHKIKADSVLITNDSCTAELNLENSTKHIKGFLYNKGNGRTEFRKAVVLNDSTFVFGDDTLVLRGAGNAWAIAGNTGTNPASNFIGTLDSQALVARTNNFERMRILGNGNIGIGTSNPLYKLDIRAPGDSVYGSHLHVSNADTDDGLYVSATVSGGALLSNNAQLKANGQWVAKSTDASIIALSGVNIAFFVNTGLTPGNSYGPWNMMQMNGASAWGSMRGIGVNSGGATWHKFHVASADSNILGLRNTGALSTTSGAMLRMYNSGTPSAAGQRLGSLAWGTGASMAGMRTGARIQGFSDAAWTDNASHPTYLTFETTPAGAVSPLERMRITAGGNVGIGTSSPTDLLEVKNTADCCGGALFVANYEALSIRSDIPNGFPGMRVYNQNGNTFGGFSGRNSDKQIFIVADSGDIAFWTGFPTAQRMTIKTNGNVGIGTGAPAYKLDVNGKAAIRTIDSTASASNMLYQDPATGEIKKTAVLPYKKYVALLSQSGTDAPTAIVLENTLGGTVTWSRNFTGNYTATLTGAFTQNKTWFSTEASDEAGNVVSTRMGWASANTVGLAVKDGTLANMDGWTNLSIEIRVYQ